MGCFLWSVRTLFFLRWIRMLFLNGHKNNCLYKKERELYFSYIKSKDERQVLNRRYHYEA